VFRAIPVKYSGKIHGIPDDTVSADIVDLIASEAGI
jgi:hypothetical protein